MNLRYYSNARLISPNYINQNEMEGLAAGLRGKKALLQCYLYLSAVPYGFREMCEAFPPDWQTITESCSDQFWISSVFLEILKDKKYFLQLCSWLICMTRASKKSRWIVLELLNGSAAVGPTRSSEPLAPALPVLRGNSFSWELKRRS